jgi:murein DD-endopeptidase MepM/ murein hydrolase activator NlpD
VYIRSSPEKPVEEDNSLELLTPGTQVTWTGNEAQGLADGEMHTWYEIETESGLAGWSASDYLAEGECGVVLGQAGLGIVNSPSTEGGNLWGSSEYHYGVDVHPNPATGDYNLYSPYDGTVVASDDCPACLEANPTTGRVPKDYRDRYNNGYGAMIVTEYRYENLTQDQRDSLDAAGVEVGPGESLYLMTGHLNPNSAIAAAGTETGAGESMATLGTSGNSDGIHGHFEAAVATSGLRPDQDEAINHFWLGTVVGVPDYKEQGRRVDPTPLFDLP